jgi:hypothetical protein
MALEKIYNPLSKNILSLRNIKSLPRRGFMFVENGIDSNVSPIGAKYEILQYWKLFTR